MMKAMLLTAIGEIDPGSHPLTLADLAVPEPDRDEVLLKVSACGVCHTELDEIEGRTPPPRLPVVPGHQVVGRVEKKGPGADDHGIGDRLGVAWIFSACGQCDYCRKGLENLCRQFKATGRDVDGGYAQYMRVNQAFAYRIPESLSDIQAAPLLCAGAIGYRSMQLTRPNQIRRLGLTGFGASAHLVLKMVRYRDPDIRVYVFARSPNERRFALDIGAHWAGDTTDAPPEKLDAVIDTTPAWKPVLAALTQLRPNGRLVINAIRKESGDRRLLSNLDYASHLWMEKEIKSVANVTRRDVRDFLTLAADMHLEPQIETYALADANQALMELKQRKIKGAKVLQI